MQKRSRKLTNKILFEQRPKGSEEQAMQASAEEFQVQGMARVKFLTRGQVPGASGKPAYRSAGERDEDRSTDPLGGRPAACAPPHCSEAMRPNRDSGRVRSTAGSQLQGTEPAC